MHVRPCRSRAAIRSPSRIKTVFGRESTLQGTRNTFSCSIDQTLGLRPTYRTGTAFPRFPDCMSGPARFPDARLCYSVYVVLHKTTDRIKREYIELRNGPVCSGCELAVILKVLAPCIAVHSLHRTHHRVTCI